MMMMMMMMMVMVMIMVMMIMITTTILACDHENEEEEEEEEKEEEEEEEEKEEEKKRRRRKRRRQKRRSIIIRSIIIYKNKNKTKKKRRKKRNNKKKRNKEKKKKEEEKKTVMITTIMMMTMTTTTTTTMMMMMMTTTTTLTYSHSMLKMFPSFFKKSYPRAHCEVLVRRLSGAVVAEVSMEKSQLVVALKARCGSCLFLRLMMVWKRAMVLSWGTVWSSQKQYGLNLVEYFFLDCLEKVYLVRKYGFNGKEVFFIWHKLMLALSGDEQKYFQRLAITLDSIHFSSIHMRHAIRS